MGRSVRVAIQQTASALAFLREKLGAFEVNYSEVVKLPARQVKDLPGPVWSDLFVKAGSWGLEVHSISSRWCMYIYTVFVGFGKIDVPLRLFTYE